MKHIFAALALTLAILLPERTPAGVESAIRAVRSRTPPATSTLTATPADTPVATYTPDPRPEACRVPPPWVDYDTAAAATSSILNCSGPSATACSSNT